MTTIPLLLLQLPPRLLSLLLQQEYASTNTYAVSACRCTVRTGALASPAVAAVSIGRGTNPLDSGPR